MEKIARYFAAIARNSLKKIVPLFAFMHNFAAKVR